MGYRLREIEAGCKFSQELRLEAISQAVSTETVAAGLEADGVGAERERKLNLLVTVFLVIGMKLYSHLRVGAVLAKLAKGLRSIWPDPDSPVAGESAMSYRRSQVGCARWRPCFIRSVSGWRRRPRAARFWGGCG
ncbi:MAG: transposase domain-containing protein [Ardenticatenaceae bacterium]|nr:transposase domain-containing protein [Ardenticatenaceae bacterium]